MPSLVRVAKIFIKIKLLNLTSNSTEKRSDSIVESCFITVAQ